MAASINVKQNNVKPYTFTLRNFKSKMFTFIDLKNTSDRLNNEN